MSEDLSHPEDLSAGPSPSMGDFFWVGTACALSVVIAGAGGYLLDSWLGTTPWLTFAGLAFGIISAVMIGYRALHPYM